jgi:hypothetical protein
VATNQLEEEYVLPLKFSAKRLQVETLVHLKLMVSPENIIICYNLMLLACKSFVQFLQQFVNMHSLSHFTSASLTITFRVLESRNITSKSTQGYSGTEMGNAWAVIGFI